MPGFRTHYLFGRTTREELAGSYPALRKYPHSYNLGQQGPDIFFYCPPSHIFYKEHLGGHLHKTDTMAFFAALLDGRDRFFTRDAKMICDAYIMGFIGHYTLDTTVHPYVHYRAEKLPNRDRPDYAFGIHVLLETDMDAAVLHRILHRKPSEFHCANTITLSKKEQAVISLLLSFAIRRAYPKLFASPAHVSFAISCIRVVNRLMHDTSGKKKTLVRMLDERLIGNAFLSAIIATDGHRTYDDPCNLKHRTWHNPWEPAITSQEDLYELMERARESYQYRLSLYRDLAVRLPENYFYCRNVLLAELGNKSYDTGLEI